MEDTIRYDKCSYFKWRWTGGTRELQDDDILKDLLNNEVFYAIRHARCLQASDLVGGLIWEVFGPNSTKLHSMWEWARSLGLFRVPNANVKILESLWKAALANHTRVFEQDQDHNLMLVAFARELFYAYKDYCASLQDNPNGWRPWKVESFCLEEGDFGAPGPFEDGLDIFLQNQYQKEVHTLVQIGWTALKLSRQLDLSFLPTTLPAQDMSRTSTVFAVAGSGKTQKIFNHLYNNFGHYMVSGKLGKRQPTGPVQSDVLEPHRCGASLDTDLIHRYKVPANSHSASPSLDVEFNSQYLALNREYTLSIFANQKPKPEPSDWLLFQTACHGDGQKFDPFSRSLKILLLVSDERLIKDRAKDARRLCSPNKMMMFCLDEAQYELEAGPTQSIAHLRHVLLGIYNHHLHSGNADTFFVLSGTSLRIKECQKALKPYIDLQSSRSKNRPTHLAQVMNEDDFPLLTKTEDFRLLFESHIRRVILSINYLSQLETETVKNLGLIEVFLPNVSGIEKKTFFDDGCFILDLSLVADAATRVESAVNEVLEFFLGQAQPHALVMKNSILLQGRIRWSILYVEHLLARFLGEFRHYVQNRQNLPETGQRTESQHDNSAVQEWITEQSLLCQNVIKTSLKRRLGELATINTANSVYMLEDLYWTAIRADLMHRPCVLRDERSGQLITEGFAILSKVDDNGRVQQKLAEPLVVRAVIEHLRARSGGYDDMLKRLLFDSQDDPSSFGKAAEYYLAWSIGGLLRSEPGVPHLSPLARAAFINILNGAKLISALDQEERIDMTKYNLHMPEWYDDTHLGKSIDFHEWLRRVREREFFPPVYFPSTFAGPDVVFIMKGNHSEDFILCAIQLKTAVCCNKKDTTAVLRTVEPNLWFSEAEKLKAAFRQELSMWKRPKHLRILTLLFTTSASCKDFWKFKLEGSGNGVTGQKILEVVLHNIAKEGRELATKEEGVQTVAAVYKELTRKPWREKPESAKEKSRQDQLAPGRSVQGQTAELGPSMKRKRADSAPTSTLSYPQKRARLDKMNFHFAVLQEQDTQHFFGENGKLLIRAIKNWKGEEAEDDDHMFELPDLNASAELKKLNANRVLKPLGKFVGIKGCTSMKKEELVNALARVQDVLERLREYNNLQAGGDDDVEMVDVAER